MMPSWEGWYHTQIEIGIVNSSNLEATIMIVSEKIYQFITEFIDVQEQYAEGYGFVTVIAMIEKKYSLINLILN